MSTEAPFSARTNSNSIKLSIFSCSMEFLHTNTQNLHLFTFTRPFFSFVAVAKLFFLFFFRFRLCDSHITRRPKTAEISIKQRVSVVFLTANFLLSCRVLYCSLSYSRPFQHNWRMLAPMCGCCCC